METKLFEADPTKHKYNVVIECYDNCTILKVFNIGEQKNMTYHELIGLLETQKMQLVIAQRDKNLKQHKKSAY